MLQFHQGTKRFFESPSYFEIIHTFSLQIKSVMKKYWKNQPLSDRRLATSASSPVKNRAILFKKNDDRFPPFAVTIPLKRKSRLLGPLTFCILSISVRESSWKKNTPFTFFDLSKRPSPSVHVIQTTFNLTHLTIKFLSYVSTWQQSSI